MRAVRCNRYGPPRTLSVEEQPAPSPGPGEVLVRVGAASVNFPDALMVANRYQIRIEPPFTPGTDFAGTIAAVGEGVEPSRVGERVFGNVFPGAYAELVAVSAAALQAVPVGVDQVVFLDLHSHYGNLATQIPNVNESVAGPDGARQYRESVIDHVKVAHDTVGQRAGHAEPLVDRGVDLTPERAARRAAVQVLYDDDRVEQWET